MGVDTKFSRSDHEKYDNRAKEEGIALLSQIFSDQFDDIHENDDTYGVDLVIKQKNEKLSFFEVEYKNYSNLARIIDEGIHIASRKKRYYHARKNVHHITFLDDYERAIMIKNSILRRAKTITKACYRGNTYYPHAKFIEIHVKKCILFKKYGNEWKQCKAMEWI